MQLKFLQKVSSSSLPQQFPQIEIICGNCCGDGPLPIKTNLTKDNRCAVCDGRSFEVASKSSEALSQHLQIQN